MEDQSELPLCSRGAGVANSGEASIAPAFLRLASTGEVASARTSMRVGGEQAFFSLELFTQLAISW